MWKITVSNRPTHFEKYPHSKQACIFSSSYFFFFFSRGETSWSWLSEISWSWLYEISWSWLSTVITSNFSHGHQQFPLISFYFLFCWKSSSSLQILFSVNSFTISMQDFVTLSVLCSVLAYLQLSMGICMLAPTLVIIFCIFFTQCIELCMNINLVYRISFASIKFLSSYVQSSEIFLEKYCTLD